MGVHDTSLPATIKKISDMVAEYDAKFSAIEAAREAFNQAVTDIKTAATISGHKSHGVFSRYSDPTPYRRDLERTLLDSAWSAAIQEMDIRERATAKDLSQLETSLTNPPPFTYDNVKATFGTYFEDERFHVLRGVAEAFCALDDAYKSHSKVKIGVEGLPKRIILTSALSSYGWRSDQLKDVLDALATLADEPRLDHTELQCLREAATRGDDPEFLGVTLRGFINGNCHLIFDKGAQRSINLALAEFYGEVLPDAEPEKPRANASTSVSADLAYFPTPETVASKMVNGFDFEDGERILEPSCGCGRILDALKAVRHDLHVTGIEYHKGRANESRAKGHHVQDANFLQVAPQRIFDKVFMNPPFAGRHYMKHIEHALRFLKLGGYLCAILPASAWYDQKELPKGAVWKDLPVGSFAASGTNVATGIVTIRHIEG